MFIDHTRYIWTYTKYTGTDLQKENIKLSQAVADLMYMILMTGKLTSDSDFAGFYGRCLFERDYQFQVPRRDNHVVGFFTQRYQKEFQKNEHYKADKFVYSCPLHGVWNGCPNGTDSDASAVGWRRLLEELSRRAWTRHRSHMWAYKYCDTSTCLS